MDWSEFFKYAGKKGMFKLVLNNGCWLPDMSKMSRWKKIQRIEKTVKIDWEWQLSHPFIKMICDLKGREKTHSNLTCLFFIIWQITISKFMPSKLSFKVRRYMSLKNIKPSKSVVCASDLLLWMFVRLEFKPHQSLPGGFTLIAQYWLVPGLDLSVINMYTCVSKVACFTINLT